MAAFTRLLYSMEPLVQSGLHMERVLVVEVSPTIRGADSSDFYHQVSRWLNPFVLHRLYIL